MKTYFPFVFVSLFLLLGSCGPNIYFQLRDNKYAEPIALAEVNPTPSIPDYIIPIIGNPCYVVPRSGGARDLRVGYYFDHYTKKCTEFRYSSGQDAITPPFETMEECEECGCWWK